MRTLVWFRRDLRITDNTALYNATQQSTEGVIALFFLTPKQWADHDDADCKVRFWLESLKALSESLSKLRIPMLIESCQTFDDVPNQLVSIAEEHRCSSVFFNREYEVNEAHRDFEVAKACRVANLAIRQFHDRVIVPPREIATKQGRFYSVFTPYRRVWNTKAEEFVEPTPRVRKQPKLDVQSSPVPSKVPGFNLSSHDQELWTAGEAEAENACRDLPQSLITIKMHATFRQSTAQARCLLTWPPAQFLHVSA